MILFISIFPASREMLGTWKLLKKYLLSELLNQCPALSHMFTNFSVAFKQCIRIRFFPLSVALRNDFIESLTSYPYPFLIPLIQMLKPSTYKDFLFAS